MRNVLTGFVDIKKQLSRSALLKIANAFCLFFIVRLALEMTNPQVYGQWLTLLSIITWFSCIEVGFSRAIRNKITVLLDQNKVAEAKQLTFATMAGEGLIFLFLFLLGVLFYFVNQQLVFFPALQTSLGFLLVFSAFYFIQFVLQMSNAIALANHRAEWPILITFVQNVLIIAGLGVAISIGYSSLFSLGMVFSISTLFALIIGSTVYLNRTFGSAPFPFKNAFRFETLKPFKADIFRFGIIQFFILIIYTTDHVIIQHYVSSEAVTEYNTAFKYFNLLNVIFNLVLVPFWSAFAKARSEQNLAWERKALRSLISLFFALIIGGVFMLFGSDFFYDFWLNGQVKVDFWLSVYMLIAVLLTMWNFLFTYYLGGIGQVKVYAPYVVVSGIINTPLSLLLVGAYQETGVIISTCISLLPQSIFLPIISKKFLNQNAH